MSESPTTPAVLVVDDHEQVAEVYETWLAPKFEVLVAHEGEEALDILATASVDVVLLDRVLPDLSGEELLVTIRDWGLDARVAMVSGRKPATDILDLRFDDYLVKPVDEATMVGTVERLLPVRPYDEIRRELTELRVKRNVLETELGTEEMAGDEGYEELVARIEELETRAANYGGSAGSARPLVSS